MIKRLLKEYDYPPMQARKALDVVMKQARLMCETTDPIDLDLDLKNVAEPTVDYTH